jgi:hypothetical protein
MVAPLDTQRPVRNGHVVCGRHLLILPSVLPPQAMAEEETVNAVATGAASKGSSPDMEEYEVIPAGNANQNTSARAVSVSVSPRGSAGSSPKLPRAFAEAEFVTCPFTFLRQVRVRIERGDMTEIPIIFQFVPKKLSKENGRHFIELR